MRRLLDSPVVPVLRIGLGILFILAAWPKLQDPEAFAKAISNYRMLPVAAERILALVLPPLELIVGVCLVVGVLDAGASLLVFLLMLVFTGAVGTAVARGLDITCGCFDTAGGQKAGVGKLLENAGLILAALWVWRGDRSRLSLRGWLKRKSDIE